MDYPCAKFGEFNFSCFGKNMRTDTETQNDRRR